MNAVIKVEFDDEYNGYVPVMYVKRVKTTEPLEDEYVYFT